MAKDFYRQAVKALNNPYDVIGEVKFIFQHLDQDFGFDTEFVQEIRQMVLNVEMTPYEYQEVSKILKSDPIKSTSQTILSLKKLQISIIKIQKQSAKGQLTALLPHK